MEKYKILKIEIALLFAAPIWVFFSYFKRLFGESDLWFARSGAIMVLLAVIVEYRLDIKQN